MRRLFWLGWVGLVVMLAIGGCTKNSTSPYTTTPADDQQISDLTTNEYADYFTFDDLEEGDAIGGGNTLAINEADTAIAPLRWGRVIHAETIERSVTFDSLHDSAYVTVTRTVQGDMRIVTATDTIRKNFTDIYHKKGVFRRINRTPYRYQNWRLVRISGISGQTQSNSSVNIDSVKWYKKAANDADWVQVGATVTDPFNFWQNADSIPMFVANDSIKVEVTMFGAGPWYGQLHYRPRGMRTLYRTPFTDAGNNQFTVTGKIPAAAASTIRRAFIDFMTHSTLFDDTAPYAANVWGLLYRVN